MNDFLRKEKVDLARYLPAYLSKDETYDKLLKAIGHDQELIRLEIRSLLEQLFAASATECLDEWEDFLQIDRKGSIQSRRNAVLAKIRGRQTVTLDFLTKVVNLYVSDKLATIKSYPTEYVVEILYHGGQVTDYAELRKAIRTYLPAHLGFKLTTLTEGMLAESVSGTVQCYRLSAVDSSLVYHLSIKDTPLHCGGKVIHV